ncbi:MAG TPA: glycosyltransferase family A protein, partial [Chitinophagaceae bacterium]|nr:glycosyltransferase family A protein [Chitinophagaceae bacterium]
MRTKEQTLFSVIIPVFNSWDRLELCLDALQKQSIDKDLFEIIIVNNGSTLPMPDGMDLPENAEIVNETQPGSYVARNTGFSFADGNILAFTDSDCIPDENWLVNAENCLHQSTCDLVGGKVQIFQDDEENKYGYLYER